MKSQARTRQLKQTGVGQTLYMRDLQRHPRIPACGQPLALARQTQHVRPVATPLTVIVPGQQSQQGRARQAQPHRPLNRQHHSGHNAGESLAQTQQVSPLTGLNDQPLHGCA